MDKVIIEGLIKAVDELIESYSSFSQVNLFGTDYCEGHITPERLEEIMNRVKYLKSTYEVINVPSDDIHPKTD